MWMMSCHRTTELLSASMDHDISKLQRITLRMHLWGCRSCARLQRQLLVLRAACRQLRAEKSSLRHTLSPELQNLLAKQTKL